MKSIGRQGYKYNEKRERIRASIEKRIGTEIKARIGGVEIMESIRAGIRKIRDQIPGADPDFALGGEGINDFRKYRKLKFKQKNTSATALLQTFSLIF